jgi:tetratricopeptide (TPR) repeat protein
VEVSLKKLLFSILLWTLPVAGMTALTNAQSPGEDARSAIRRGNEKFAKSEYEAALKEYRRVPEGVGERYAQSLYNIGVCYYELWRTEDAIIFYRRAIQAREGRYPRAWYALGVALEDQGAFDQAKEAYGRSITASGGEFAVASFKLGLLLAMEDDYHAAASLFRDAGAGSGEFVPASHNNLGVMLAHMGRLNEARHEFEIALHQTGGALADAAHNLKLCRSLLRAPAEASLVTLRIVNTNDRLIQ